jgi:hypothetical protein
MCDVMVFAKEIPVVAEQAGPDCAVSARFFTE